MADKTADLINLCATQCIKPMACICDACIGEGPFEEWTTEPLPYFPPINPDRILKQSQAEGWELRVNNPIRWLRGNRDA